MLWHEKKSLPKIYFADVSATWYIKNHYKKKENFSPFNLAFPLSEDGRGEGHVNCWGLNHCLLYWLHLELWYWQEFRYYHCHLKIPHYTEVAVAKIYMLHLNSAFLNSYSPDSDLFHEMILLTTSAHNGLFSNPNLKSNGDIDQLSELEVLINVIKVDQSHTCTHAYTHMHTHTHTRSV